MKKSLIIILLLLVTVIFGSTITTLYDELEELTVEDEQIAHIQNIVLKRDVATINLQSGDMYLLSGVNGRRMFMLYEGEYHLEIAPTDPVAQQGLETEYGSRIYQKDHDILFLVSSDSTYEELVDQVKFRSYNGKAKLDDEISYCLNYFYNEEAETYSQTLLDNLLNEQQGGYFYAHAYSRGHGRHSDCFEINPGNIEEVSVYSRNRAYRLNSTVWKLISRFNREDEPLMETSRFSKDKDKIIVDKYTIHSVVDKKMDFSADCQIDFTVKREFGSWLCLPLCKKLEITSIFGRDNLNLEYDKREDSWQLWVNLGSNAIPGDRHSITIKYGGDLIKQGGSHLVLESYNYWYPQYITTESALYDLTFSFPKKYDLVTVGSQISTQTIGKNKIERWVADYPVNGAPFNLGKFKRATIAESNLPVLEFYIHKGLKQAKADVTNSVNYFQTIYGKCLYDTLKVADLPSFWEAGSYNGIINFYNNTKLKSPVIIDNYGFGNGIAEDMVVDLGITEENFMILRTKEVSRQWWGCGVQCADYNHDLWLFEGLADFSSIWFLQNSISNSTYFDELEKRKAYLLAENSARLELNYSNIPLTMGYVLPEDMVVSRGSWVFHMLRNMMIDLKTFDETRFKAMLKDFQAEYQGKAATTEDFKRCVEKHTRMDMDWFFEQWIYGSEVPEFEFDYEIITHEDATLAAKCMVTQKQVSSDFVSYLPVEFEFANGAKARIRHKVTGEYTEFEVNLPQKPKKVKFNVYESVLSRNF